MKRSLYLLVFFSFILPLLSQTIDLVPVFKDQSKLLVFPLFFVPKDANFTHEEAREAEELLNSHLKIAQEHYKRLLKTDTFSIANETDNVFRSNKINSHYEDIKLNEETVFVDRSILLELIEWKNDDRINSKMIYLAIYVRPSDKEYKSGMKWFGGGRTFNGVPNSGGGYIEMEYSSLLRDYPYPFQSTLVHELGHAFGLTHVDCFGYDMNTNDSIMSYNISHWSKGFSQSASPGSFNPEDFFILSLNKRAFPDFEYKEELHNPSRKLLNNVSQCFLGPMDSSIGEFIHLPGTGYELFFNQQLVSGPAASYYSLKQAQDNCDWNIKNNKGINIECRYNGVVFHPKK